MQGWGRRGEGEGDGGRAQRTAEPAELGQLRRSLALLIRASPLPSSSRRAQHPLQTLGPHAPGRPAPAARGNCLPLSRHPDNFLFWCLGLGGCFALGGFLLRSHWRAATGKRLESPKETPATHSLPPAGLPSGLRTLSSFIPQP